MIPAAKVAVLHRISPFFVVDDLAKSLDFYCAKLGFAVTYTGGGDGQGKDFFGIIERDGAMLMLKSITPEIHPQPNPSRHQWARWDAYIDTSDPDSLYREYVDKGVPIHSELSDTGDGLRAFEITDNSGYVLCFGRPLEAPGNGTR
ncbi:MAG: VOC family protein [Acidobacteriia bacterium]|nr:VOC family protein [Terriglobia bacterium]